MLFSLFPLFIFSDSVFHSSNSITDWTQTCIIWMCRTAQCVWSTCADDLCSMTFFEDLFSGLLTFSFVSIRRCWRQPPICWTLIFTGLCHICVRQSVEGSTQDRTTATSAYSSTKDVRRARKRSSSSGTHTHIICSLREVSTMPFDITKQNILHTLFFVVLLYCFYKTNVNSVILIKFYML